MRPILVLLLATLACSSPSEPGAGLRTETSVSASTLRAGEPITVNVEVANAGSEVVKISPVSPGPFQVLNESGDIVGPESPACELSSVMGIELAPGASHTFTSNWAGGAYAPYEGSPVMLQPGTYLIRGAAYNQEHGRVPGESVEVRIEG